MKNLNVVDYGTYSYIQSIILYFSSIPLFGLPLYLQRNIATGKAVNLRYMITAICTVIMGLMIAFMILPEISSAAKVFVLIIISYNILTMLLVAVNDAITRYTSQYKFLFMASIWMFVCIIEVYVFKHPLTINMILTNWVINSVIVIMLALINLGRLWKRVLQFEQTNTRSYGLIFTDLLMIYSVSIPDGFAKFYDKFLANKFLDSEFLGNYSFNLMLVITAYAFFVRPINSFFINQLSKNADSTLACSRLIRNYYGFSLGLYAVIYLVYALNADFILNLLGLARYQGTVYLFKFCFINMLLYILSYPFIMLLALSHKNHLKLTYCVMSLIIFNLPLAAILIQTTPNNFLMGFLLAYFLNLTIAIIIKFKYAKALSHTLFNDLSAMFKFAYGK